MEFDFLSGLIGLGVGWLIQWFLIDRPLYRRDAEHLPPVLPEPSRFTDTHVNLGQSSIDDLKLELRDTHEALESANAEIERLRMWSLDDRDDLKLIKGLGPVSERKLLDAGISTYKQLAEMNPAEVIKIVRSGPWPVVTPDTWIEQAKKFSLR